MICPHCRKTIREEDRYLMSVDRDSEPPSWAAPLARYVVLFLVAFAFFAIATHAVAS